MLHQQPIPKNFLRTLHKYVPKHAPPIADDITNLATFIQTAKKLFILTGAGVSTESGIPDYRSEAVGLYARSNHKPVQYTAFLKSEEVRARYWARNYIGWPKFGSTSPNETHHAIKRLGGTLVTQNVDGLHTKAGSRDVIELHGTAFRVLCLACNAAYDRHHIQQLIKRHNPNVSAGSDAIRPDGDVDIAAGEFGGFRAPQCERCGGVLKPDITFFGDNVPKARVDLVRRKVSESDAILVLGSSLTVFSGYRIVLQGDEEQKPVCIVNIGPTRADALASLKIEARCGDILPKIV